MVLMARTRAAAAPAAAVGAQRKPSKYGNRKVEYDGHTFDSKAERERYLVLKIREVSGEILDLQPHPVYRLEVNGKLIGRYTPDFSYRVAETGEVVVEDVKSKPTKTEAYGLRKRLMRAIFGIEVQEIMR
jgi:hypothetical protein